MVSTNADHIDDVKVKDYIQANYSPEFSQAHSALHPDLSWAEVSTGQEAAVADLLASLGGTAYVLNETAQRLVAAGKLCGLLF